MTGTLHDLMAAASARAAAEGYYSAGTRRVVLEQRIALCRDGHGDLWLNEGGIPVCGTCHPPARPEAVTWL